VQPVQNAFQKLSCTEQRREGVAAYLWYLQYGGRGRGKSANHPPPLIPPHKTHNTAARIPTQLQGDLPTPPTHNNTGRAQGIGTSRGCDGGQRDSLCPSCGAVNDGEYV
jgi:hypothetical protein